MHGLHNRKRTAIAVGAGHPPVRAADTATARSGGAAPARPEAERRSWALLILLCVAQFMVILDATVVNVALPSIARSLSFTAGGLQWVVTAYVLASGGLVLLGGRSADVLGRRRMFLAGLSLFTVASLASGLAPSAGALIAARAGQGAGAALLTPAALAIITAAYSGAQRATALATWGAIGGGGAAAGVLAGGMLTTWLGWRSVFLVNAPVGLAAGLLTPRLISRSPGRGSVRDLDLRGAVLAVGGLVSLAYAISEAPAHGWGSVRTLGVLGLALVLLAAFALTERTAARPLVPSAIWRNRSLVAGILVMLGSTVLLVGTFFLNSLYLQQVAGASPLRAGLEFLPVALIIGASAHVSGRLLPHAGTKAVAVAGLILMAVGAALLTRVPADPSYLSGLLPGLLVTGAGTGLVLPATAVTAMDQVSADRTGLASGLLSAGHEIGATLGVAVFSAVSVAVSGGIGGGYQHGFAVMAAVGAGLAILAALIVPAVRPAAGTTVAVH